MDALYIGGGFPESHAALLAENSRFRFSLRSAVEAGLPVYAECGGLMYLGENLIVSGEEFPMAGVFPVSFAMEKKPQGHGYTIVKVEKENPFFPEGAVVRGHEFHYSRPVFDGGAELSFAYRMERGFGFDGERDGLCYKNVLAAYSHVHAGGEAGWAEGLVRQACLQRSRQKRYI